VFVLAVELRLAEVAGKFPSPRYAGQAIGTCFIQLRRMTKRVTDRGAYCHGKLVDVSTDRLRDVGLLQIFHLLGGEFNVLDDTLVEPLH